MQFQFGLGSQQQQSMNQQQGYGQNQTSNYQGFNQSSVINSQFMANPQIIVPSDINLNKIQIKGISENISDTFMEALLSECGSIVKFSRCKINKKLLNFGYVEFEEIQMVYTCIRCIDQLQLLDKQLTVRVNTQVTKLHENWKKIKYQEYVSKHLEKGEKKMELKEFLDNYDQRVNKKIQKLLHILQKEKKKGVNQVKQKQQNKDHPREKERAYRQRQFQRTIAKKYRDKFEEWNRREQNQKKKRQRQQMQEKQRIKEIPKLIQKELEWNSDDEKERRGYDKQKKILKERSRMRQKELEQDVLFFKRLNRNKIDIEKNKVSTKQISKSQRNNDMDIEYNRSKTKKYHRDSGFVEVKQSDNTRFEPEQEPPMPPPMEDLNFQDFQVEIEEKKQSQTQKEPQAMGGFSFKLFDKKNEEVLQNKNGVFMTKEEIDNESQDEDNIYRQNKSAAESLPTIKIKVPQKNEVLKFDKKNRSVTIKFKKEQKEESKEINKKKQVQDILKQIPKSQDEVFSYEIDWKLMAKSNLLDTKIKAWIALKAKEYMGTEEPLFIDLVLQKLRKRSKPKKIIKKVTYILEEHGETFVYKLWRMMIFLLKKYSLGL